MVQTRLLKQFRAHDGCSASHSGDGEDMRTVGTDASTRDTRVRACVCMCARVLKHACVTDVEALLSEPCLCGNLWYVSVSGVRPVCALCLSLWFRTAVSKGLVEEHYAVFFLFQTYLLLAEIG